MKKFKPSQPSQRGFTLVEISIVLIIIGVLAIMGARGAQLYQTTKNQAEGDNINRVMTAFQVKYQYDATTTGLTNAVAISSGVLQNSGWQIVGSTITNAYSSSMTFKPTVAADIAAAGDGFVLTTAYPSSNCSDIARIISANAYSVKVNGVIVSNPTTPMSGSFIDTNCSAVAIPAVIAVYTKTP